MELKEVYDYLLSARRISDEIWRKDLRRQELKACLLPAAITYDKDRVQTTPEDGMAKVLAEVVDLDSQIVELQKRRALRIMEVSELIDRLEDSREAAILDAYYLGGRSMKEIAGHLHYSMQHTYRMRRSGAMNMLNMLKGSVIH